MLFNRNGITRDYVHFLHLPWFTKYWKIRRGESAFSNWQTQSWYPELLRLSVKNPIILPLRGDLLKGRQNKQHALIQHRTIQLAAWVVSGSVWQRKEYQKGLQILLSHQEEKELSQLTHRPGISGLASVLYKTLFQFDVMWTGSCTFLPFYLSQNMTICTHKSAISVFHNNIEARHVGEHQQVRSLITSVFNNRPPQPKYGMLYGMFTWCWITWKKNF